MSVLLSSFRWLRIWVSRCRVIVLLLFSDFTRLLNPQDVWKSLIIHMQVDINWKVWSTHALSELCRQQWRSEEARRLVSSVAVTRIPERVGFYYRTNNRKRRRLCSGSSNNPHPCASLLPSFCWLDFVTSVGLVSPRADLRHHCLGHIVTQELLLCAFYSVI